MGHVHRMNVLPESTLELGGVAYTAYCNAVGGKSFNGDALPTWGEMLADPKKLRLVEAWAIAADAVITDFIDI